MAGAAQGIVIAAAFGGALVLLSRLVSPAAALINLGITGLLAVALVLQGLLEDPLWSTVALALAAVSFVLRWVVNAVIWVRRHAGRAGPPRPHG
jgi:hypothetical protein